VTTLAILLILLSAGIHATWNLYAKRLAGGSEAVWLFTLVAVVIYAPPAAIAVYVADYRPETIDWLYLLGTGVLQAIYFTVLRRGYAAGDLSIVYPLARGSGPLMAMFLAVVLIGERPSPLTIAGAVVVTLGTLLLATPVRSTRHQQLAVAYGVATGMVIGCYTAWDGYAVGTLAIPALLMGWAADAGRLACLTPVAMSRRSLIGGIWRRHRLEILGIGVLSTLSYVMVLSAMAIAPISSIAPAREISIVFGTILGMTLLGEPGGARRLAAATIIAAGVGVVALG
jgi:drug/metabolite transporter (DMT)-like permease